MREVILTSYPDFDDEIDEIKIPKHFGNRFGFLDALRQRLPKRDRLLYVASAKDSYEITDFYAGIARSSFALTLPFKEFIVLDGRNSEQAETLVQSSDLIFLAGGHVPTQNAFFQEIGLKELLQNSEALIVGGSAGSMNMAEVVYAPPELPEDFRADYCNTLPGLGLTDVNIFPHVQDLLLNYPEDYFESVLLPDSYQREIIMMEDGAYLIAGESNRFFGPCRSLQNGMIKEIEAADDRR